MPFVSNRIYFRYSIFEIANALLMLYLLLGPRTNFVLPTWATSDVLLVPRFEALFQVVAPTVFGALPWVCHIVLIYAIIYAVTFIAIFLDLSQFHWFHLGWKTKVRGFTPAVVQNNIPTFTSFDLPSFDGHSIRVQRSARKSKNDEDNGKRKVCLLCAPIGEKGPESYFPLLQYYGDEYDYISWDYRGSFGSLVRERKGTIDQPNVRLCVHEHVWDALAVLRGCGFDRADLVIGHSMGTVVAMELALLCPSAVGRLILMNGFHGHVFSTAFQPLVRVPLVGNILSFLCTTFLTCPRLSEMVRKLLLPCIKTFFFLLSKLFTHKALAEKMGEMYLPQWAEPYIGRLCDSPDVWFYWLRFFQELNAHSIHHMLGTIQQPTLVISGFFDLLTPIMQSVELCRGLPNATHYCSLMSSHCTMLERPASCLPAIEYWMKKTDKGCGEKK